MRILIYKQTHIGDPDKRGCWGGADCMGRVRNFKYDAVISAGGIGDWPQKEGINGRITWLGQTPTKYKRQFYRGSIVQFKKFKRFENSGPLIKSIAPNIAKRLYSRNSRYFVAVGKELLEAKVLLNTYLNNKTMCKIPNKTLSNRLLKQVGHCIRSAC